MSVKLPKAEVASRQWHFRFVPTAEVAKSVEEPSTASLADVAIFDPDAGSFIVSSAWADGQGPNEVQECFHTKSWKMKG